MKLIYSENGPVSQVSDEDHIFLAGYRWSLHTVGYLWCQQNDLKNQYLHRIVAKRMGLDLTNKVVDHINFDKLDNRRENLRAATHSENHLNGRRDSNAKSGYRGVYSHYGRWQAKLMINGVSQYLGNFATPEEAHAAYLKAAEPYLPKKEGS